jgi:hypothetical protein
VADVIAASGVLLTPEDAEYLLAALDEFARLLSEKHARPSPKFKLIVDQLRKTTRKCSANNGNATSGPSSRADEAESIDDGGHATVSTPQAAEILGVAPSAVRAMAHRNPGKLGSRRVGGRWRHDLALVELRAARVRKG